MSEKRESEVVQVVTLLHRSRALAKTNICSHWLVFLYRSETAEAPAWREVVPYGLLYGLRVYLVAAFPWTEEPVNYRIDRMSHVRVTGDDGHTAARFQPRAYAALFWRVSGRAARRDAALHPSSRR
ncbi:MAG: WYL domain-containing protein [Beijerinckiaceae bacterium]|jgi:predicted DNA-binding transcriptional regulator YafY